MILLPRPLPHLGRTHQALADAGFTDILPLALSLPHALPLTVSKGASALLITSALAVTENLPRLPAYCVGGQTAAAAQKAGLKVRFSGTANAVALANAIVDLHLLPQHFLHPHGEKSSLAFHRILKKQGHSVTAQPAYHTGPIAKLPAGAIKKLKASPPTHTLLFSPGSARHLANLMKTANIPFTGTAVCFSPAVATVAKQFWPRTRAASRPALPALIACLKKEKNL